MAGGEKMPKDNNAQNTQKQNAPAQDMNQLLKVRREKLAALQEAGKDPFQITKFDVTNHSTDIKDHYAELEGKTVGIIGLGAIGLQTAKLFLAFGAKVIAYNRSEKEEAKALGIEYKTLDEVLSQSDIVSLNLPNNAQTKGLISKEKIALMKNDALFINCARGPIVDNKALADALNNDELGFACIDVYDMEPPIPEDYPLLHAKNTVLTPHQAFISEEAMERRAKIVFDNVSAWLDGNPINVCR